MELEKPFALHLTWTTYATWLPGDPRGYVSHTLHAPGDWEGRANTPGTEYASDHPRTYALAKVAQKYETVWLTLEQARVVAESAIAVTQLRGWRLIRGAIMANHVHMLLIDCPTNGPEVRRVLKGNSQAALSKNHGRPRRWWTAGGSDRYKNDHEAIEYAMRYIENHERILVAIRDNEIWYGDHWDRAGDHRGKPGGS